MRRLLLLTNILLFLSLSAWSDIADLPLNNLNNNSEISFLYKETDTEDYTPEYILNSFTENNIINSRFTYPFRDSYHWFGTTLKNNSDQKHRYILYADESFMDKLDLYILNNSQWIKQTNGLRIPLKKRDYKSRYPAFIIDLEPDEERTIILKAYMERTNLNIGFYIDKESDFRVKNQLKSVIYLIFIGSITSIFLYNLFLLLSIREPLYLYYVIYAFFQTIWVLLYSGYSVYLFPDYRVDHFLSCGVSISTIALILFITDIFDLKKTLPGYYRIIKFLIPLLILIAIATAINVRVYALVVAVGMPVTLFLFIMIITGFIKKLPQSGYLLFGMGWYIAGLFIIAGVNMGAIPHSEFNRYAFLGGSYIEFIVFSLTLASRINSIQQEALNIKQELLQSEEETNKRLQVLVDEKTKELQNMVIKDPLTSLYNRRHLQEFLVREWARHLRDSKPICVIMFDIDHFKKYNDNFGHQKGDDTLIKVSSIINNSINRGGDIVARYGGEEFIAVLTNCTNEDGVEIADKIMLNLKDSAIEHITDIGLVTLSIGVASITPTKTLVWEDLIKCADEALYLSKSSGRNKVSTYNTV